MMIVLLKPEYRICCSSKPGQYSNLLRSKSDRRNIDGHEVANDILPVHYDQLKVCYCQVNGKSFNLRFYRIDELCAQTPFYTCGPHSKKKSPRFMAFGIVRSLPQKGGVNESYTYRKSALPS